MSSIALEASAVALFAVALFVVALFVVASFVVALSCVVLALVSAPLEFAARALEVAAMDWSPKRAGYCVLPALEPVMVNSVYSQGTRVSRSAPGDSVAPKPVGHSLPGVHRGELVLDDCPVGWREGDSVPADCLVPRAPDRSASTVPWDGWAPDDSVPRVEVRAD